MSSSNNINQDNNDINKKIQSISQATQSAAIGAIIKAILGFFIFLCVGYYTMWLSNNYVKRETFEAYTTKQDQLLTSRFDSIQNKLEIIINKQTITTEQFKNFNVILESQQKTLDNLSDRVTFMERTAYKNNMPQPVK